MAAKKFFDSSLSSSAFEREAALLADLRHPNVVQLIKVWAPLASSAFRALLTSHSTRG